MSRTSNFIRSSLAVVATLVALGLFGSTASAQVPIPSSNDPTMIGGRVIGGGRFLAGFSTGYPETQARLIWGMSSKFDLGLTAGLTYANRALGGINQRVGLDLQVPLRFTIGNAPKAAFGIRVVPFFRVGQYSPSIGVGGTVGFRANIALPKVFQLIVGAETRAGFNSSGGGCDGCGRFNAFEGATYAVVGLETLLKNKYFLNLEFDPGGWYMSGGVGGHGMFNAHVGFGALIR